MLCHQMDHSGKIGIKIKLIVETAKGKKKIN